jgi:transcriptional regulator with XRE-family HTH domain
MQYTNELFFAPAYSRLYSPRMDIGARLDKAMKDARFDSQSDLARRSGVPQATISRILKGAGKKGPETETIKKLAKACHVSFEWLNEGDPASKLNPALANQELRAAATSNDLKEVAQLIALYGQSTEVGRAQIMRAAGFADKTVQTNRPKRTSDNAK